MYTITLLFCILHSSLAFNFKEFIVNNYNNVYLYLIIIIISLILFNIFLIVFFICSGCKDEDEEVKYKSFNDEYDVNKIYKGKIGVIRGIKK